MAICRTFFLLKILIFDGENQKKCIKSLMHFFITIFHGCLLIRFSDFKKNLTKIRISQRKMQLQLSTISLSVDNCIIYQFAYLNFTNTFKNENILMENRQNSFSNLP